MTKGERNQMLWYEEELQRLSEGLLRIHNYLTEKHPDILKEYNDHRLAEAIGFLEGNES